MSEENNDIYSVMERGSGKTREELIDEIKRGLRQEITRYKNSQHKIEALNLLSKAKEDIWVTKILYKKYAIQWQYFIFSKE